SHAKCGLICGTLMAMSRIKSSSIRMLWDISLLSPSGGLVGAPTLFGKRTRTLRRSGSSRPSSHAPEIGGEHADTDSQRANHPVLLFGLACGGCRFRLE